MNVEHAGPGGCRDSSAPQGSRLRAASTHVRVCVFAVRLHLQLGAYRRYRNTGANVRALALQNGHARAASARARPVGTKFLAIISNSSCSYDGARFMVLVAAALLPVVYDDACTDERRG